VRRAASGGGALGVRIGSGRRQRRRERVQAAARKCTRSARAGPAARWQRTSLDGEPLQVLGVPGSVQL
jgi:hypothetical protein